MNSHQRRGKKRRAELDKRRELSPSDQGWIAQRATHGSGNLPKSAARAAKKTARHMREEAVWGGKRFSGMVDATGKEMDRTYVATFRVKDGSRHVSEKCWLRRGVK